MNLSALAKSLERLSEADAVVADRYLQHTLQGLAVNVLAGAIGLSGLVLWEFSAFWFLEPMAGSVLAAALLGAINFALAALLLLVIARKALTGELASALRMRQSAITQLEQDLIPHRPDTLSYPVRP